MSPPEAPAHDMWRDGPLRYLGYANEVGEAFRLQVPRMVVPSYGVAIGYVLCDTADKAAQSMARGEAASATAATAADVLLWQGLASVAIPGLTINSVVKATAHACASKRAAGLSPSVVRWAPTLVGLAVVPLIIAPIDAFTDALLDSTTRKLASEYR